MILVNTTLGAKTAGWQVFSAHLLCYQCITASVQGMLFTLFRSGYIHSEFLVNNSVKRRLLINTTVNMRLLIDNIITYNIMLIIYKQGTVNVKFRVTDPEEIFECLQRIF